MTSQRVLGSTEAACEPVGVPMGEPASGRWSLRSKRVAGFAWAALAVSILAGWFVVTRFGMTHELRVWDIAALRFGGGALVLLPFILRRRLRPPLRAWRRGLLFSFLWGTPFVLTVALGLQLTSAGEAATIAPTMMPVFAGLFARLFLGERPGRARWLGYGGITLGVSALVAAGALAHGAPNPLGLAALLVASAMWATYTLLFRRSGLTSVQAAAMICIWSAVLFVPVYLLCGLSRLPLASAGEVAFQALYQGGLMSGVAIVTFNRAVMLLGPSAATAIIALLPGVATLLAVPVLGEVPSAGQAAAIGAIVLGVGLIARPAPARAISLPTTAERRQR